MKAGVCSNWDMPSGGSRISYWSQARPGSFISAFKRMSRFSSKASTRQKSTASPTRRSSGCRRPLRRPAPPSRRSAIPLQSPGPVGEEPSSGAADAGEDSVDVRGCRTHRIPPAFDYHTLAGLEAHKAFRVVGNVCGVAPGSVDSSLVQVLDDAANGGRVVQWSHVRKQGLGEIVGDDNVVAESFHEGGGDLGGNGGHPMDPVGREAGREDRDGDEEPSKASGPGVAEHQPSIGGNVCAADLDGAVHALGFVEGRDQVGPEGRRWRWAVCGSRSTLGRP